VYSVTQENLLVFVDKQVIYTNIIELLEQSAKFIVNKTLEFTFECQVS